MIFKIEDPSVSGSHAQIVLNGGAVMVKDLGSTNGTFINRSPVTEAALQPGHCLRLGGVEMLFQCEATASTAAGKRCSGFDRHAARAASERNTGRRAERACACSALITSFGWRCFHATGCSRSDGAPPVAAPPVAPPLAPPIVPGMVEAPPGMTTCKYHPKTAGQWLCQNCRLFLLVVREHAAGRNRERVIFAGSARPNASR